MYNYCLIIVLCHKAQLQVEDQLYSNFVIVVLLLQKELLQIGKNA